MAEWVTVVDDDPANRLIAEHILQEAGIHVTSFESGSAFLVSVQSEGSRPDLVLLDIRMPEPDGFETLRRLRELEKGREETPVVFLTADDESESEKSAFAMGVSDYIEKPFDPDVLIRRIRNILSNRSQVHKLREEVSLDAMTGFLNKQASILKMQKACMERTGCLCIADLDSFKPVNDLFGHDTGDKILIFFTETLKKNAPENSIFGRIGGDEFLLFLDGIDKEEALAEFSETVNRELLSGAKEIADNILAIPLGVSLGAVFVPEKGTEYTGLFQMADKALLHVKQNGKHGYFLASGSVFEESDSGSDLKMQSASLNERYVSQYAMWMGQESFGDVYRYMMRYIERYRRKAYKILFSARPKTELPDDHNEISEALQGILQRSLRNSDFMMQTGDLQFFLFLPEVDDYDINKVIDRIMEAWKESEYCDLLDLTYESEGIHPQQIMSGNQFRQGNRGRRADWIVVVDDDVTNLKLAGLILSKANMRVTALRSGRALLDFVKDNHPDLILLDIKMPDMDGFEALKELRSGGRGDIPVVFLTADESEEIETTCLKLGAMDFIKKPFALEVLTMRVRHIVDLTRLQKNLEQEVDRKAEEVEKLSIDIVRALAEAIDAKDTYTNGHSSRVAEYAREIAKRFGYTAKQLEEIYMMGLLHDVGKIGVPDAVINKPARLNEDEYEVIKNHPVMGARILKNIKEMPKLSVGARWHHERYDGTGYPDGLKGEDIPQEARIIAVADAYDAMSSRRSYRDLLSQEKIREELINCRGTQFDPVFADIMLAMIEEDKQYTMREH